MKKFIKPAIICLVTIVSFMSTPMAYATNYNPLDVNHDNSIDMADVVTVQMYLNGGLYCPTYNQLDANQSSTVDYNDVMYIQNYLLNYSNLSDSYYSRAIQNNVAFPTISGFTPDAYASSTSCRKYRRYSYVTNQELSTYYLTPSSTPIDPNMDNIIGPTQAYDERYEAYGEENTGIVRINSSISTGFIVGDHVIATAAHCVYHKANNINPNNFWYPMGDMSIQTYNSNGTLSTNTLTPVEAHVPDAYITGNGTIEYDYALITVTQDLSNYVHFALGNPYNVDVTNYSNIPLYLTGCPNSTMYGGDNTTNRILYSTEGHVNYIDNVANKMYYDMDASEGQSGSPVYTITQHIKGDNTSYTYTALAIHRGAPSHYSDYNWGALITKYQLQFYLNNPNI